MYVKKIINIYKKIAKYNMKHNKKKLCKISAYEKKKKCE